MMRTEAELKLKEIFGIEAFYESQWNTIEKILQGKRVLLIEKTGFGKSLCYQFPATQFNGITIVFSPLLSLMRDQVKKLNSLGIKANCINSEQNDEENKEVIEQAKHGNIKILYIAPERQESIDWIEATKNIELSMIVIDEAHCISMWGHDFRPSFRRIINLVQLLPSQFPVLATTATATVRVEKDIIKQMGGDTISIRGNLIRENFYLRVVKVKSEDEKLIWIGTNLNNIPGNGIIYTGTRINTEIYSNWLNYIGIPAIGYNAGLAPESRKVIEDGLLNNRWKCVISTNALGMGIDKPDIGFIIHTQIPASPIHYYQEIGRAGRDGSPTLLILFYNQEDVRLQQCFIDQARPSPDKYYDVINTLMEEPMGEFQIMRKTDLRQTQIRVIRADLLEQKIIREVIEGKSKKYEYQFNAPDLNTEVFEELRNTKLRDLRKMIEYAKTDKCRMKFLCDFLGDTIPLECEKCDNDCNNYLITNITQEWIDKLKDFWANYFPVLELESSRSKMTNGIAASFYGKLNVGNTIERCKYKKGGDFPDSLVEITLRAFDKKLAGEKFDMIVYVPPVESGDLVEKFAQKISLNLNIPLSYNLKRQKDGKPQRVLQNKVLKKDNVSDVFIYANPDEIKDKTLLIIDDVFDTGATINALGRLFTKSGVKKVVPLVIAKTMGGDLS